jgi:hypothetical protein
MPGAGRDASGHRRPAHHRLRPRPCRILGRRFPARGSLRRTSGGGPATAERPKGRNHALEKPAWGAAPTPRRARRIDQARNPWPAPSPGTVRNAGVFPGHLGAVERGHGNPRLWGDRGSIRRREFALHPTAVSGPERGSSDPQCWTILRLAHGLGVELRELVDDLDATEGEAGAITAGTSKGFHNASLEPPRSRRDPRPTATTPPQYRGFNNGRSWIRTRDLFLIRPGAVCAGNARIARVRWGFRRSVDGADAAGLVAIGRGLGSGRGLLPKPYAAGGWLLAAGASSASGSSGASSRPSTHFRISATARRAAARSSRSSRMSS